MANGDGIVSDQDFFDHQPHDPLALGDIERLSGGAQAGKKGSQGLGEAQEYSPVGGLIGDRLQLGADRALALPQQRHALA